MDYYLFCFERNVYSGIPRIFVVAMSIFLMFIQNLFADKNHTTLDFLCDCINETIYGQIVQSLLHCITLFFHYISLYILKCSANSSRVAIWFHIQMILTRIQALSKALV